MQEAEEKKAASETHEKPEELEFGLAAETPESAAPFALEKTLTVMVKVGENDFSMLRDFLDMADLEYEVM